MTGELEAAAAALKPEPMAYADMVKEAVNISAYAASINAEELLRRIISLTERYKGE